MLEPLARSDFVAAARPDEQCESATLLQIDVAVDGPGCTVRLGGELDMLTVAQLRKALDPVCEGRHRLVVIDLGGLRFVSLAGLRVLVETQQTLHAAGGRLVLTNPNAITMRVLALTGLDEVLHLVPEAQPETAEVALVTGPAVNT